MTTGCHEVNESKLESAGYHRWMNPINQLSREQLYELVWSEAMSTLAPKYGIRDVGLKKRCKSLDIPTPGRGYWARLSARKPVKKEPLPISWSLQKSPRPLPKSAQAVPRFESPLPSYPMDALEKQAAVALKCLRRTNPDHRGMLEIGKEGVLGLSVSPEQIERGVWLWSGLIALLRPRGLSLSLGRHCLVTDGIETVRLMLKEARVQFERKHHPKVDPRHYSGAPSTTVASHAPNGYLRFQAEEVFDAHCRRIWRDTRQKPLDAKLDEVADGIVLLLTRKRKRALEVQEAKRRWAAEALQRELSECELRLQTARREKLLKLSDLYVQAEQIRRFIRALEVGGAEHSIAEFHEWALSVADAMDPCAKVVAALNAGEDPVQPSNFY